MPYGTKAPKELQHHLPTLVLRRPSISARPPDTPTGVRGSRMRDRRPPTYRCPAVPGLVSLTRAILMALDSSVLPSGSITCQMGYCVLLVLLIPRTAGGLTKRHSPAVGPVARPASAPAWNPTAELPGTRVRSPTPSPRAPLNTALLVLQPRQLRPCSRRPLITAGHPVRSSVPSPSRNKSWLRNSTTGPSCVYCCPAVRVCRALLDLGYERNHKHTGNECLLQQAQIWCARR